MSLVTAHWPSSSLALHPAPWDTMVSRFLVNFKIKKEIQFYLNKYNKNSLSGSWVDVNIIKFLPTKSFFLQYLIQFSLYIGFDEMTSVQFSQCAVLTKVNVLAPIRGLPTSTTSPSPPPRPLRQLLPPPAFSDHSWQELSSSCFHSGGWPYTLHLTPYNLQLTTYNWLLPSCSKIFPDVEKIFWTFWF